jgi:flagellar biosynthesis protein FlhF
MTRRKGEKTYTGETMKQALARVRRDLGGGAVILGSREIRRRRLFGLRVQELVEVTATAQRDNMHLLTSSEPSLRGGPLPFDGDEPLSRLHQTVSDLSRQGRLDHLLPDLPADLVSAYASLLEGDLPEALARRLVRDVAERLDPVEITRPDAVRAALGRAIEAILPIAPPIRPVSGAQRVVALIGPTGVGKTTTVAKLAATFKLLHGFSTGLVTVDTYRIAAVEQLRTFAEIIDLPLAVASTREDIRQAIDKLGAVDIVLIDTAGRSPRDELRIRELGELLAEARPDEVHLVLSAVAGERSLRAAVDRFAAARPDRLILTKLDEAEGLGGALAVIAHAGRPVSYLTTGQAVPDDIEPADRRRLARMIVSGQESVVSRGG